MLKYFFYTFSACILLFTGCQQAEKLPYFGKQPMQIGESWDTIISTIPPFEFTNQNNHTITQDSVEGKIYVADFFFTSCPSICPIMKRQMMRINQKYLRNDKVVLLSHTIDPKRDTPEKLNEYFQKLQIETNGKWHFLTGEYDNIYYMAEQYMISAYEDNQVPGGFEHSGKFILVDQDKMIRGFYDGTNEEAIDQLLEDMDKLLQE